MLWMWSGDIRFQIGCQDDLGVDWVVHDWVGRIRIYSWRGDLIHRSNLSCHHLRWEWHLHIMVHQEEWVQEDQWGDHQGMEGMEGVVHRSMGTTMIAVRLLVMVEVDMMIVVHHRGLMIEDLLLDMEVEDTMIVGPHLGIINVEDMVVTMMMGMEVIGREEDRPVHPDVAGIDYRYQW